MALLVQSVSNCKYISVQASQYTAGVSGGTIKLIDAATNQVVDSNFVTYPGSGYASWNFTVQTDNSTVGGVYLVTLEENGTQVEEKLVLLHCDIDCCLVKLTNELIACECDCARCAKSLAKAQKIFLLLNSAKTAVDSSNIGDNNVSTNSYQLDAYNKYTKAKEICDLTCGCNC
tara:strand:+ start:2544 stop:3065 length:522 start_codon:yes stop_codon:yes gene_type:complete